MKKKTLKTLTTNIQYYYYYYYFYAAILYCFRLKKNARVGKNYTKQYLVKKNTITQVRKIKGKLKILYLN